MFYECSPKDCPCGDKCSNQRFQKKERVKELEVIEVISSHVPCEFVIFSLINIFELSLKYVILMLFIKLRPKTRDLAFARKCPLEKVN